MPYGMSDEKRKLPLMARGEKTQSERFKQAARELEVEMDEGRLRENLRKLAKQDTKKGKGDEGDKPD